ncbi:MAG TPA: nucleotide exchange factor GrpE [Vicinamibacterales bacterium]|nr:nucleotide exchange factor GrpE [Vicinamibacterales bacterium]
MADEHEIPVKVVDRRWWAREKDAPGSDEPRGSKPSYVEELERRVAEAEKQAQDYLAKYRQSAHEFEDARARMRKELAKDAERSRREVLVSLLEVIDNLDRAIEAAKSTARSADTASETAADPLLQGVEMVRRLFLAKLEGFGVKRIESQGALFDPRLHEAVTTVDAAGPDADGRIVGVIAHGYRIGDDVLRPALVAVGQLQPR